MHSIKEANVKKIAGLNSHKRFSNSQLRTLSKQLRVKGKRVLVRVDFNVPLKKGKVVSDKRIREALPTITYLLKKKAKVILISHLGRPEGVTVDALRMKPVAERLSKLLKKKVIALPDSIGKTVREHVAAMKPGEIVLLENVRFYAEEEQNNAEFAGYLAELGDLYVNDAFGTCHRAHASVDAITRLLPSYSGFLLQKEISMLTPLLSKPKRPFVVLLGGAKIRDKLPVIEKLLKRADAILIGGAMMFTFLAAQGKEIGESLCEPEYFEIARKLLHSKKIILPLDVSTNKGIVSCDKMKKGMKGLDIGPETEEAYVAIVKEAKTVFWNGPMGLIEQKSFAHGTIAIAKALAKAKAITLIGGGDTLEIIEKLKLEKKYTHLSTGGGATLEFLSGKNLPGLAALDKKHPVRLQKKR